MGQWVSTEGLGGRMMVFWLLMVLWWLRFSGGRRDGKGWYDGVICELFLEIGGKKNGWVSLLVSQLLDSAVYREGMNWWSLNWFRPLDLATCPTFIPSSQNYAIITYLTLNFGFSSSIKFIWLFNLALCFKFILTL
jgi:hypothetical protein